MSQEAGFHSWTDPSSKYAYFMTPLQYEELHFPGSLVRLLSLTRSAAPGPCGKSYDELELRRGTSIILALDALLSVFPSFPFCPSHHRMAVSAHWYCMGCRSLAVITKQRIKTTIFSHRESRNLPKGFGGSKPTNLWFVLSFRGYPYLKSMGNVD